MLSINTTLDDLRRNIARIGEREVTYLEKRFDLVGALELRRLIPIQQVHETLLPLTDRLAYFSPHQYIEAGAQYGSHGPFFLREGVVARLNEAQTTLEQQLPGARLKVFDAFRPKSVQIYMRNHVHRKYAIEMGWSPNSLSEDQVAAAWRMVDAVWALPSNDPSLPTPHSTGAAVDLTIVDHNGDELPMGSEIDESSERVLPSYYARPATPHEAEYAINREFLRGIMEGAGFCCLSHEWWHFSYGDQFWALVESLRVNKLVPALYGEYYEQP